MSDSPRARTVLVTGSARRLGREIALALAAGGWQVAIHYRGSVADAQATVDDCRRVAPAHAEFDCFAADLADEAQVRALLPRVVCRFGQVDAVVNNASLFEHDSVRSFGPEMLFAHLKTNTGAPMLLAQALHEHVCGRAGNGVVVNLLDQKLWNHNPDFLSYTLVQGGAGSGQHHAGDGAGAAVARGRRGAGPDADQPPAVGREVRGAAPAVAAGALVDAAGRGGSGQIRAGQQSITGTTLLVDGGQHLMKFRRDFLT